MASRFPLYEIHNGLSIIGGLPALYFAKNRTVVISDLHVGIENVLAADGVFVPISQQDGLLERVRQIKTAVEFDHLIVDGDFKHSFSIRAEGEMRAVREVAKELSRLVGRLTIVRGNHDNFITWATRDLDQVHVINGNYQLGNVVISHGHETVDMEELNGKVLVIGHEHPAIEEIGNVRQRLKMRCFLKTPLRDENGNAAILIVLPAFTDLASGVAVNKQRREEFLSPVYREFADHGNTIPYVINLEGSCIELPRIGSWN